MNWGAYSILAAGAIAPIATWTVLWRGTSRRAAETSVFAEDPTKVDQKRQARVPLALAAGFTMSGSALCALTSSDSQKGIAPWLYLLGLVGIAVGLIVLPLLALATVSSAKPRWLPRITGEAPRAAQIRATTRLAGAIALWPLVLLMAFAALGIGSGIDDWWAGTTVLFAWPLGTIAVATRHQRLEIRPEGVVLTSFAYDYSWLREDIECIHIDAANTVWLRDTAGRQARALNCPLPKGLASTAAAILTEWGYNVVDRPPAGRWRPQAIGVMRRRRPPVSAGHIAVSAFFACEAVLISVMGVST